VHPRTFHLINGDASDPQKECKRVGELISQHTIDAAFVGIGENGHLAFNDPPADFSTHEPYLVVNLDDACRQQQVGEGWFESIAAVPAQAISMSIQQIVKSAKILCVVPDRRSWSGSELFGTRVSPCIGFHTRAHDRQLSTLRLHYFNEEIASSPLVSKHRRVNSEFVTTLRY
jgi:glucosamine-6-phosphate deaminase